MGSIALTAEFTHPGCRASLQLRMIRCFPERLFTLKKFLEAAAAQLRAQHLGNEGATAPCADEFVNLRQQLGGKDEMCSMSGHWCSHFYCDISLESYFFPVFFFFFFAPTTSVSRSPTMCSRMKLVAPDLVRVPATIPTIWRG